MSDIDFAKALAFHCPGASWSLAGNTYEGLIWHDLESPKPSLSDLENAWAALQQARRGWANVQGFMDLFTMQEKALVALSTDSIIAALRLTLSTWLGRVEIQDERVQLGLGRMVQLGIISPERKTEIEAAAA